MGYSLLQISEVLLKADKTMYRLGAIAYENMFSEDSEDFDFERDVIYIYKKAVEYADELYTGTTTLDELVERLANKLVIYNYGQLNPIYSNAVTSNSVIPSGSVLNDLNDVTITNLQNNQILRYDSSLEQWVNSGTNTAIRSTQSFTATLNQTVFVTSSPFTVGLIDVYLNGVRLNSSNYSTFGSYTITLYDGCLADDIIDVTILEPVLDVVDLSPYALKSTTITINGVTYDLSTNRTWIIDALPPQTGNSGKYLTTDGTIASWGTINLTGYVPYTGATASLNLGEFQITAGQVTFDQSPTGSAGVGVMRWNNTEGTLDLGLKGGNVTLQVGQEQVVRVVNKSGAALNEAAYQVVKITDAQGQRLAVDLAQGNNDANSTDTIGIVTETIANNQEGFITTSGLVNEINTTGILQGETWVDGDVIYLSPFTAGAITNIKPTAPNHTVTLGYVVYAHAIHGKIFAKCDNGYELGELHNCYLPTPANNDGIFWNTVNQRYQNNSIAGILGYTPVPTSRTITTTSPLIGGGDLSADRTLSIPAATSLVNGYLTSTDWSEFKAKQGALNGTGFVKISGTTISYDNSTYLTGNQTITLSGDVSGSGSTAITTTIGSNKVTNAMLAQIATASFLGRATAGTGNVETLTGTQATSLLNVFSSTLKGLAPASGGGTTNFLRADGTWATLTASVSIGTTVNLATAGSIFFAGTAGVLAQNNANLFWDNTNNRLGIGITAPAFTVHVLGEISLRNSNNNNLTFSNKFQNNCWINLSPPNITSAATFNTSVGMETMYSITSGSNNVTVGYQSMYFITSGSNNTGLGYYSLRYISTGGNNVGIGRQALENTLSSDNVAVGVSAVRSNTAGTGIVAIGKQALEFVTGNNNTALGYLAGFAHTTGTNNIFIGASSTGVAATDSNRTFIGNSSTTSTWLGGNLLLGSTTDNGARAQITGKLAISAGTTGASQINLASSTAPTSPNNGDIWFDGTNLKMQIGGVTKTFTIV